MLNFRFLMKKSIVVWVIGTGTLAFLAVCYLAAFPEMLAIAKPEIPLPPMPALTARNVVIGLVIFSALVFIMSGKKTKRT